MKKYLIILFSLSFYTHVFAQEEVKTSILKELSATACKCIDSISTVNKGKIEIAEEINKCIGANVMAYQLGAKMSKVEELKKTAPEKDGKKQIDISIATDVNSSEYKKYYYELERYLMDNCPALKKKLASHDKENENSYSKNQDAINLYEKGVKEMTNEKFTSAIDYFEKALKIDPKFAFAYDNIGISYRKLGDFDKAIEAYEKSLQIDPKGQMPLQNIAVAYQYKKDYVNAIKNYEKLAEIDPKNPEIYYGIGQISILYLNDYEKGLNNLCKAYNIYVEQKSAYRTDAEKLVSATFVEMKKAGKEQKFYDILKENNIKSN